MRGNTVEKCTQENCFQKQPFKQKHAQSSVLQNTNVRMGYSFIYFENPTLDWKIN